MDKQDKLQFHKKSSLVRSFAAHYKGLTTQRLGNNALDRT